MYEDISYLIKKSQEKHKELCNNIRSSENKIKYIESQIKNIFDFEKFVKIIIENIENNQLSSKIIETCNAISKYNQLYFKKELLTEMKYIYVYTCLKNIKSFDGITKELVKCVEENLGDFISLEELKNISSKEFAQNYIVKHKKENDDYISFENNKDKIAHILKYSKNLKTLGIFLGKTDEKDIVYFFIGYFNGLINYETFLYGKIFYCLYKRYIDEIINNYYEIVDKEVLNKLIEMKENFT